MEPLVEFEQAGNLRAEYGKALINNLAADLGLRHGRGFSRSNLVYMRLLYQRYPISQKPSHQLSWSHYVELLKLDDELERGFYEKQAIAERWSVPELKRQKASSLFLRLVDFPAAPPGSNCAARAPCPLREVVVFAGYRYDEWWAIAGNLFLSIMYKLDS